MIECFYLHSGYKQAERHHTVHRDTVCVKPYSTVYLYAKGILVCIKTFREEAGHEVVHICDVSDIY